MYMELSCSEYLAARFAAAGNNAAAIWAFGPFSKWLEAKVDAMGGALGSVPSEVLILNQPPAAIVTEYRSMWAYGNHYRCENALLGTTHVSYDSGVACIVNQ
jgi:hypothetical protein